MSFERLGDQNGLLNSNIMSAAHADVPNLVQIRPWRLLGKWVKYNENFIYLYLFISFFGNSPTGHNYRDHQVVIVGGPNTRPTNPRWRTAAIFKQLLNRHISATV